MNFKFSTRHALQKYKKLQQIQKSTTTTTTTKAIKKK
jgi:hypothetical protein